MNSLKLCAGLMLVLSVALCFTVAAWQKNRQELRVVTEANESVRKTLGEMTVAIAQKDKEVDRLSASPCSAGDKSHVLLSPAR